MAGKTSKKPQKRYNIDDTYLVLSYIGIGGLIGTATSGWMANSFGRKYSLLSMAIPQIVSNTFDFIKTNWSKFKNELNCHFFMSFAILTIRSVIC